ncbi:YqaJ viral recombinase family protein [Microvirga brassicacearum]|uniref:Endonuclease n=1 Tax=Microvirga brassicacearum TaxID=2580413 RepID=A0A5N3PH27_9HYPH|nr:YqaJ viral recombinase family protein [Microvirga brassicacearum]KAB0269018.1 endonuclease [Microvirga brassicacearum]
MSIQRIPAGDRNTWLELRQKDVTASAVAALLDVHPFITGYELWALKTGVIHEDPEETPEMQRGRLLEPVAVQLMRETTDWKITHNTGADQVYLRDPAIRLGATIDVFAVDNLGSPGVVQIKSVAPQVFKSKWHNEAGELEAPIGVVLQALTEADLAGAEWAAVAPLVVGFGLDMPLCHIPINKGAMERVREAVVDFWQMIAEGREPEPDWNKDDALLNRLGKTDNGTEVNLSGDNRLVELLHERTILKAEIKEQEGRVKEINEEIVQKLGPHERAYVPGFSVRRPTIERRGYTVQPTTYRQLTVKALNS